MSTGPTLNEIRSWPAAVTVAQAASALRISRAHAYQLVRQNDFPAHVIKLGGRSVISTASLLRVLEGETA